MVFSNVQTTHAFGVLFFIMNSFNDGTIIQRQMIRRSTKIVRVLASMLEIGVNFLGHSLLAIPSGFLLKICGLLSFPLDLINR